MLPKLRRQSNIDASIVSELGLQSCDITPRAEKDGQKTFKRDMPQLMHSQDSVPDGGFQAWLQAGGSFMLFFNTWGIINSYGVYQDYYTETLLPASDASDISWIGSLQSFLVMFVGALSGPLYDAGLFRALLVVGSTLVLVGYMTLSLCGTNMYWQIFLAQGVCIGIGSGLIFVPSVAILSQYFRKHISFAVGIAASGSSLGGVICPVLFRVLVTRVGFGWTVRITGFIAAAGLLFAISTMRMRVRTKASRRRAVIDLTAFTEPPYVAFCVGIFLAFMGMYTPFYYVQNFALSKKLTHPDLAHYLLAIINSASVLGRLVPNLLADKLGPFNIMAPCASLSGVFIYCMLSVGNSPGIVVLNVFFGFFSGTFVSLMPSILVKLSPNPAIVGTRMGMNFVFAAVGLLIGTPIAGSIESKYGFDAIWIYGGSLTVAGAAMIILARALFAQWCIWVKV